MSDFALHIVLVLVIAAIVFSSASLIANAWINGDLKHRSYNGKKIIKQIIADIKLHPTN